MSLEQAYQQLQAIAEYINEEEVFLKVELKEQGLEVYWHIAYKMVLMPAFKTETAENFIENMFKILAMLAPWLEALIIESSLAYNGIISWKLDAMAYSNFSRLKVFKLLSIKDNQGHAKYSGILVEDNIATRLLDKMPVLEELSIPSPYQDNNFFQGSHPLKKLSVDDIDELEYTNFIPYLAQSSKFPDLQSLYLSETVLLDVEALPRLPIEHYLTLFQSQNFPNLLEIHLSYVGLNIKEIQLLQETPLAKQLCQLSINQENPQYPQIKKQWLSDTVVKLIQKLKTSEDVFLMTVLGDALELAGCEDMRILGHCHSKRGHLKNCWLIELLLAEIG